MGRGPSLTPDAETLGAWLTVLGQLVWLAAAAVLARAFGTLLTEPQTLSATATVLPFLGLWLARAGLDLIAQRLLSRAADARIADLRAEIIAVETRAASASAKGGAGALAAMAAEKLDALRPALLRYRPTRLRVTVVPLVILGIAAWHSWAVALVLLMAGPLIPVFMALVGWAAKDASARQMTEIGQMSDLLVDRLAALSDLKLIGAGPAVVDEFARSSEDLRQRTMAVLRIAFLSSTVLELFSALGVAMVAIWVGFSLLGALDWGGWGTPLSLSTGLYLLLLAPEFFQPLRDLAAAWHDRAASDAVLAELDDWRDEDRLQRLGTPHVGTRYAHQPVLETRALCHRGIHYPDIRIEPGARIALVAPSGGGKSTLLRLLAGLERPDAGEILLDGRPLDDDIADDWRAGLGWMPQAPHFGGGSLRHNVGFGAPVAAETYARTQLAQVLAGLARGDQTRLGERGAGLSGGEARRVTLARALHGRPDLLLADEPTADLDARTAGMVTDGLMQFADAGGTLIIATHDPDLAARMSRRIGLETAGGDA